MTQIELFVGGVADHLRPRHEQICVGKSTQTCAPQARTSQAVHHHDQWRRVATGRQRRGTVRSSRRRGNRGRVNGGLVHPHPDVPFGCVVVPESERRRTSPVLP